MLSACSVEIEVPPDNASLPMFEFDTDLVTGIVKQPTTVVVKMTYADGTPASVRSVNVIGLRRAGIAPADRRAVQEAHRLLYRSGLAPRRALERMRSELPAHPLVEALMQFVASSKRGICAPPGGWAASRGQDEATGESESEGVV